MSRLPRGDGAGRRHGRAPGRPLGGGHFGYFPTYSLGNVLAGQLWDRIALDLPGVEEQIGRWEFAPLRDWLREHLHRHGNKLMPKELMGLVVGGPIDVGPYLRQLRERAAEIYGAVGPG